MKLTAAMKKAIGDQKSVADVKSMAMAMAREKNATMAELEQIESALLTEFSKGRTRLSWQVAEDKRGGKWLNIYRQMKQRDGSFKEINSFSKKTFNVPLSDARIVLEQLANEIDGIIEAASKAKPSDTTN